MGLEPRLLAAEGHFVTMVTKVTLLVSFSQLSVHLNLKTHFEVIGDQILIPLDMRKKKNNPSPPNDTRPKLSHNLWVVKAGPLCLSLLESSTGMAGWGYI